MILVRVAAEESGELRKFTRERADPVGVVVAAGEAHVAGKQDGVGLLGADFA